ncbi:hypothetical protein, partial [Erwinia tracheiphila]|uniref:hypothetical protein n=1 Tax=Erwinia tracheiphila TaxID=65700 RepID=UPI001F43BA68
MRMTVANGPDASRAEICRCLKPFGLLNQVGQFDLCSIYRPREGITPVCIPAGVVDNFVDLARAKSIALYICRTRKNLIFPLSILVATT